MNPVCQNATIDFDPNKFDIDTIITGHIVPILCIFGVICNCLVVIILSDNRFQGQSASYGYLLLVAILDTISLLELIGFTTKSHFGGSGWPEFFDVYLYWPIASVSMPTSLLLLVAMTADRCVFILNNKSFLSTKPASQKLSVTNPFIISGLITLASVLANIPRMFYLQIDDNSGCIRRRLWATQSWFSTYNVVRFFGLKILPLIILAIFNAVLLRAVRMSSKQMILQSVKRQRVQRQQTLTVTLLAATLLAILGEVPIAIFNPVTASLVFGDAMAIRKIQWLHYCHIIAGLLVSINYSANFVVYCILNVKFRRILAEKLACKFERVPVVSQEHESEATSFYS